MDSFWRHFWFGFILGTIFWLGLILSGHAKADTGCKANPLYCKIVQFNPSINRAFAGKISNQIAAKAKRNKIDANIALAILMQESALQNINTYKTTTSVVETCTQFGCAKITTTREEAFDISIAQINVNTAQHFGFDIERLYKLDTDYALDCFFIVLIEKIKTCKSLNKTPEWSCYHSSTDEYRIIYTELVKRYL